MFKEPSRQVLYMTILHWKNTILQFYNYLSSPIDNRLPSYAFYMFIHVLYVFNIDLYIVICYFLQLGCAGCSRVKTKGATWCWWEGWPKRSAVPGDAWTQRGLTPACPWMRSACWASWELCPVNHAKVNKQTIKKKENEYQLRMHCFGFSPQGIVLVIACKPKVLWTHILNSHIVNKHVSLESGCYCQW